MRIYGRSFICSILILIIVLDKQQSMKIFLLLNELLGKVHVFVGLSKNNIELVHYPTNIIFLSTESLLDNEKLSKQVKILIKIHVGNLLHINFHRQITSRILFSKKSYYINLIPAIRCINNYCNCIFIT